MKVLIGCCGFPVSLPRYARELSLVEVQKTFYRMPQRDTLRRWRDQVPPDFVFTLKVPQLITHPPSSPTYRKARLQIPPEFHHRYGFFRPTDEVFQAWEQTLQAAEILRSPVLVFQTPARFSETPEHVDHLYAFFSRIPREGHTLAWEPRGTWHRETLRRIFQDLQLVHVVDPFKDQTLTPGFVYYRLHGRGQGYRYSYSDEELRELRRLLPATAGEAYILFNNTNMYQNALRFQALWQETLANKE